MTSYDYTWHIHVLTFVETYYPFILHTPNKSHFNIELIIFIHFYRRWIHHFPHLPPSPLRSTKTCSAEMAAMGAVRLTSTSASHATKLDTFEKLRERNHAFAGLLQKKGSWKMSLNIMLYMLYAPCYCLFFILLELPCAIMHPELKQTAVSVNCLETHLSCYTKGAKLCYAKDNLSGCPL